MTTPNELVTDLKALVADFAAKRKVMVEGLKTDFHSLFTEMFDKCPTVKNINWVQYAPYFNDGDACTFNRHEFCVALYKNTDPDVLELVEEDDEDYDLGESDLPSPAKIKELYEYYYENKLPTSYPFTQSDEAWYKPGWKGEVQKLTQLEYWLKYYSTDIPKEQIPALQEVAKHVGPLFEALESIPDDVYEELFGEHAMVCVTRKGVEVGDYDHD